MVTSLQVAEHRAIIDGLVLAASGDARVLLSEAMAASPVDTRKNLIRALPSLIEPYSTASAEISAVWYEDLRSAAVGGRFAAATVDEVPAGLVSGIARRTVSPFFGQGNADALSLLIGSLQKAIAGAGRSTIRTNIHRDSALVGYARSPRPGCCAFCAMLASRGAAYGRPDNSERGRFNASLQESLRADARATLRVKGRGVELHEAYSEAGRYLGTRGGGVVTKTQDVGDKFHDFCRCVAVPIFEGESLPYDRDKYLSMYKEANGSLSQMRLDQQIR